MTSSADIRGRLGCALGLVLGLAVWVRLAAAAGVPASGTMVASPNDAPTSGLEVPVARLVVPDEWTATVAGRIARQWHVPAGDVRLTWGRIRGVWPAASTPYELAGRGADGWFVVVLGSKSDAAQAIEVRAGLPDTAWVAARPLAVGETLVSTLDGVGELRQTFTSQRKQDH